MPIRVFECGSFATPASNPETTILKGSDRIKDNRGSRFRLDTCLRNVEVSINGLIYISGEDFFVEETDVVILDEAHGGTINIINSDIVEVRYNA